MTEQEYFDRVSREAYQIYLRRINSPVYEYGNIGNEKGDWYQAEDKVKTEIRAEACGISPYNRIEKYF